MKIRKIFLVALLTGTLFISCFKDMDDEVGYASTLDVQNFIYRGLNHFYLYKSEIPELANDAFTSGGDLNTFLSSHNTPESLFEDLLAPEDRFSFLANDYRILENGLDGISLHNGMEFGLIQIPATGEIFGYVRYVLPNSSAQENGVERGMIFNSIDGQTFTESNYGTLLSATSYSIGLATLNGTELVPTGESIALTKGQYTENPVYIHKVLQVNGQKIGYLMYNAFTSDFDGQLNAAFANFKAEGITDLVLDVRYNGGGSIETANDLSSMITGQFEGKLFITQVYNENFESEERFFNNQIGTGGAINSLNLGRVFVLTTSSSASASELVISALMPYIDVVQIGDVTTGKFQGSTVVYDSPDFSKINVSLGHRYAMLPLILKSVNADGFTDYADGIAPDILLKEDYTHLGILGEPEEPLLAMALSEIFQTPRPSGFPSQELGEFIPIGESGMHSPLYRRMITENQGKLPGL